MSQMLEDFSKRLGIHDSSVIGQANEYLRRINLKQHPINESAKIILSIDCASSLCSTEFDRDLAVKLSGLKKKEYNLQKESVEKSLNVGSRMSLDAICAHLSINEAMKRDAACLLKEYNTMKKGILYDIDLAQFHTMAVYQSCKLRNFRIDNNMKTKLIQLSKLKPKAWKYLEEEWDKWIVEFSPLANRSNKGDRAQTQCEITAGTQGDISGNMRTFESQTYEEWRDSIIKTAVEELKNAK